MQKWLLLLLVLCGCGTSEFSSPERIGLDPSWYPIDVMGREPTLLGFAEELVHEIAHQQGFQMSVRQISPENLFFELKKNKVQGILSTLYPYPFNEVQYAFSPPILLTGPVLVVRADSKIDSMEMVEGKEIGVPNGTSAAEILEKYPGIYARFYDAVPNVLAQVTAQIYDGAIVDALTAQAYCHDLFNGVLKIVTPPLNEEGFRLVAVQGQNEELMKSFSQGLQKLKDKGKYDALLEKWGLKD